MLMTHNVPQNMEMIDKKTMQKRFFSKQVWNKGKAFPESDKQHVWKACC
jgi:hypothetical protein